MEQNAIENNRRMADTEEIIVSYIVDNSIRNNSYRNTSNNHANRIINESDSLIDWFYGQHVVLNDTITINESIRHSLWIDLREQQTSLE